MTVAALARTIRRLPAKEQAKLFHKLGATLEDYLLARIALDRLKKASHKRISWEELKP